LPLSLQTNVALPPSQDRCAVAVSLFDQVPTRYPGTRFGYDATWQAAGCYETLGDTERAKRSYQALLDDPTYGERAKTALAQLERADGQPIEVAARKRSLEQAAPAQAAKPTAGAAAPAKTKAKSAGKPSSPVPETDAKANQQRAVDSQ